MSEVNNEQVVEPVVEGTPQTTVPEINEYEDDARAQGWVPKDEFRGKESDWIDAETFVKRGREINPILRKNNERIQRELDKARQELQEVRMSVEEFKKFTKEANERRMANYEAELMSLREQKKQAITNGDGELAVQLDDQIDAVKEAKAAEAASNTKEEAKTPEQPAVSPKIQAWIDENKWYSTNKVMATTTNAIALEIRENNPFFNEDQFIEALNKELENTFSPEKLGKKVKRPNPVTETGNTTTTSQTKGKQTYDSLPADAKAACDNFIKQGWIKSREDYVKEYYSN